tara:strand:- start:93 stop:512 length:420 start_codon:yes stop_codon:yes gene_type:complete
MKKIIKKDEDRVTLDVSLSTEEMRSGKTVLFTLYDAQNFLKKEGYNITTCVEDKSVINVGLNANNRGKFVFLLKKEKTKPVIKVEKPKVVENVEKLKDEPKLELKSEDSTTSRTSRTTNKRTTRSSGRSTRKATKKTND